MSRASATSCTWTPDIELSFTAFTLNSAEYRRTFLGPFVQASGAPLRLRRFPPRLGQHNTEIYVDELGLARDDLARLRQIGAL